MTNKSIFSFLNFFISKRTNILVLTLLVSILIDDIYGGRWGGTDTQQMNELHQMETNHSNFVQNYYRSENKYNKKLNAEMQAIQELNYMKKNQPDQYKKIVSNLQKNGFIRGGQLVGNWYSSSSKSKYYIIFLIKSFFKI